MNQEDLKLFYSADLFEPLSRGDIERFAARLPVMDFERGRHLYTPAYRAEIFFLLLRGRVRTYRVETKGEITLGVVGPGEICGEEVALVAGQAHRTYAQVLEPSRVSLIHRGHFERLVQTRPQVGLKAIEILTKRLGLYESKLVSLGLKEVPSRLAGLILELVHREGAMTREGHKIVTRYTHEQLGTMIGAKRVAVSRALTELRRAGAVEVRHRRIYVRDMETLEGIAG